MRVKKNRAGEATAQHPPTPNIVLKQFLALTLSTSIMSPISQSTFKAVSSGKDQASIPRMDNGDVLVSVTAREPSREILLLRQVSLRPSPICWID